MTDRELLERAAKAAGLVVSTIRQEIRDADGYGHVGLWIHGVSTCWNPLNDNGDAFSLAISIGMTVSPGQAVARKGVYAACSSMNQSIEEATRRAIVVAAASLAEKPTPQN